MRWHRQDGKPQLVAPDPRSFALPRLSKLIDLSKYQGGTVDKTGSILEEF